MRCPVRAQVLDSNPGYQLPEFLAAIGETVESIEYFENENPQSPELGVLIKRRDTAWRKLSEEFGRVLERHSEPIPTGPCPAGTERCQR